MEKVIEYFLEYVVIDTESKEGSKESPSTPKQHNLAGLLTDQLTQMGAADVYYDKEHCYVYASIPATAGYEASPVLGFIAHMDTSPAMSGASVKPRIIPDYDGQDIVLNRDKNVIMKTEEFPELYAYKGKTLIVTDGTTLLGADDKAGVAEIMAMAEHLLKNPQILHGKIRIGFTPDEEIGAGADFFDIKLFGADFAYTVDGGRLGELEYENFNAAGANVIFHGRSVHPGDAKDKMKNALLMAMEFQAFLPEKENPMYTEGYEGFYHLDGLRGNVEEAEGDYIIRDHNKEKFESRKMLFRDAAKQLCDKYGEGAVEIHMKDSYYNMYEIIRDSHMHLIENAAAAMEEAGIEPIIKPIRGGTDGARLTYMGLPCPNLCTGGHNFHGRLEYACAESMSSITALLIRIAERYGSSEPIQ